MRRLRRVRRSPRLRPTLVSADQPDATLLAPPDAVVVAVGVTRTTRSQSAGVDEPPRSFGSFEGDCAMAQRWSVVLTRVQRCATMAVVVRQPWATSAR